ncbi:hypothetical protein [Almyronema epifaneia]|uniref:Uncharacterized protein n=1 Tax=Almyronema epifaneia S1 TaxID=2991925 RepID=A0ABW6IB19_9CYAN
MVKQSVTNKQKAIALNRGNQLFAAQTAPELNSQIPTEEPFSDRLQWALAAGTPRIDLPIGQYQSLIRSGRLSRKSITHSSS